MMHWQASPVASCQKSQKQLTGSLREHQEGTMTKVLAWQVRL
jgi:hypothetical protein